MSNDSSQQLPPQGDRRENEVGGLLAAASDFARSVLESIQALAGTTSCKGVQIARLKDWAISHECWIDKDTLGTYSDRGSENEVYTSLDSRFVYKLNDFRFLSTTSPLSSNASSFIINYSLIVAIPFLVLQKIVTEKSALCFVSHSFYPSERPPRGRLTKKWNDWDFIKNRMTAISPIATTISLMQSPIMY